MKIVQMRFCGGKSKAFTTSYDDGVRQDERLIELMEKYGIKGTFNLNSGILGRGDETDETHPVSISTYTEAELNSVYEGQEIASHGVMHKKLTEISPGTVAWEVVQDRKELERITNRMITGFAYPFGVTDSLVQEVLKQCGIQYARTIVSTKEFGIPKNFLEWNPTCHHNDAEVMDLVTQFIKLKNLFAFPALFYLWGHAYEFDMKNNWEVPERIFEQLQEGKEDIWFATNQEICSYVNAFRRLQYSADGSMVQNHTSIPVWIWVDGVIHEIPPGALVRIDRKKEFLM